MITQFSRGRLYRHPGFMDVDMWVVMPTFEGKEKVELKVRWWHRSLQAFIPDAMRIDKVRVKRSDFHKWQRIEHNV